MKTYYYLFLISAVLSITACAKTEPVEKEVQPSKIYSYHGYELKDDYAWIKDDNGSLEPSSEVNEIIEEKNQAATDFFDQNKDSLNYVSAYMEQFQKADKHSFAIKEAGYELSFEKEDQDNFYRILINRGESEPTSLILDVQKRAAQSDAYDFAGFDISSDGKTFVFGETLTGHFSNDLYLLHDKLPSPVLVSNDVTDFVVTANGDHIVYVVDAFETRIFDIKTGQYRTLKLEQENELTHRVYKSAKNEFIFLSAGNAELTEVSILDFSNPNRVIEHLVVERSQGIGAAIDYIDGALYAVTYTGEVNSLLSVNIDNINQIPSIERWNTIFVADIKAAINQYLFLDNLLLMNIRNNGTDELILYDYAQQAILKPELPDKFYTIWLRRSLPSDEDKGIYRFWYESYLSPRTVGELNIATMKVSFAQSVSPTSDFDKDNYIVKREHTKSHDGVLVPVTIIYHKDTAIDGSAPALLYAYGAYGSGIGAEFSSMSMALVDKGFIYAVAHVRGGDELGERWYEDGRQLKKKNSFEDFIHVVRHLVTQNYTHAGNISMRGESAAGLIIGYALNNYPDWFKSATVLVPFFDPMPALLDDSLPYVDFDRNEYGNPVESKEVFDYVKSYSPFGNIVSQGYPHTYITGGMTDPSAGYWEPLKWTLKKQALNTSDTVSLVRIRDGGHIANTPEKRKQEFVNQIAFVLWAHGVTLN